MTRQVPSLTAALLLLVTGLFAQAPEALQTFPTGPNPVDSPSSVTFEARFDQPVLLPDTAIDLQGAGGPFPFAVRSGFDSALFFDASVERAFSSGANYAFGGDFTVEFWYRADVTSSRCVFSYSNPGSDDNEFTVFTSGSIWVDDSNYTVPAPPTGVWNHWAFVHDSIAATLNVYVNGSLSASLTGVGTPSPGGILVLGDDQDSFGGSFQASQSYRGAVDELRIWNVVRNDTEIQSTMSETLDPMTSGLGHYWRFDAVTDLPSAPGTENIEDLSGDADFELRNGLNQTASRAANRNHVVTVDTSAVTIETDLRLGLIDGPSGGAQNPQTGDFLGTASFPEVTQLLRNAVAPQPLPSNPGAPTLGTTGTVEITFDQPVQGVDANHLVVTSSHGPAMPVMNVRNSFDQGLSLSAGTFGTLRSDGLVPTPFDEFTLECWFRSQNAEGGLFSFAANSTITNGILVMAGGRVYYRNTIVMPTVDMGQLDGAWHHMLVSRSATGEIKRFIDGIPAGTVLSPPTITETTAWFCVGNDFDSFGAGFSNQNALGGGLDEIRVWSTVRDTSPTDPARLGPVAPHMPGLLHYFRADQLADLSVDAAGGDDLQNFGIDDTPIGSLSSFGNGVALTARDDLASTWLVDASVPAGTQTCFVGVDPLYDGTIQNAAGLGVVPSASSGPVAEAAFVEDLTLTAHIDGGADQFGRIALAGGEQVELVLDSPAGSHDWQTIPVLFGQFIAPNTTPVNNPTFPEVRLDLSAANQPVIIYDGANTSLFGPGVLTPGGVTIGGTAPPVVLGSTSLVLQPFVLGGTTTTNGIFAVGNVIILDL